MFFFRATLHQILKYCIPPYSAVQPFPFSISTPPSLIRPSPQQHTFVHVYIPLLTQYCRRGSKVGSGGGAISRIFKICITGNNIINFRQFVYVYFKFFSLSSPIIIYLKFIMISFSNPNVQHVFFFISASHIIPKIKIKNNSHAVNAIAH